MTSILYISLVVIFCCNALIVTRKQLVKAGLMAHLDRNITFLSTFLRHILDWPIRNGSLTAMDLLTTLAFLLVFIILWKPSFRFRYCIKFIYFNTVVVFMTGVCILPIAIWKPKSVDNLRWVSRADFKTVCTNSAIHKAASRRLERPPGVVPAASSIHGLWEFSGIVPGKIMEYSVRLLLGTHTRHSVWLLTKLTRPNWILQDRIKIMIFYIINAKIHINILLSLTFII